MGPLPLFLKFILLADLLALTGCFVTHSGDFHDPTLWPLQQYSDSKEVSLSLTGRVEIFHNSVRQYSESEHHEAINFFQRRFKESGAFSEVTVGSGGHGMEAEIILEESFPDPMYLPQLFTLGLLPRARQQRYILTVTFSDASGILGRAITKMVTYSQWYWNPGMLVPPILIPNNLPDWKTTRSKIFGNLARAALIEARSKGIF